MMRTLKSCRLRGPIVLGLAAMFALSTGPSPAAADGTLEEIKDRGTIRLAGPTWPPYIKQSADGSYSGIDVDIVKGFAKSIGVGFEVVSSTWGTAIAGVQSGKWDVAPVFCKKPEREKVVTFLEPHYRGGGVAVRLAGSGPESIEQLNDESITFVYPAGTWKEDYIAKHFPKAQTKVLTSGSTEQVTLEILSNRGDASVVDAPIDITKIENAYPGKFDFLPSKDAFLEDTTCIGSLIIKKDAAALAEAMNRYIRDLKARGGVDELYNLHVQSVLTAQN